ncbi:MAG TPA: Ig-like domain-containing protein, partial [Desertimonas sp.]|nr:Ig-like domain-containing protein [Desertimonas sp.]
ACFASPSIMSVAASDQSDNRAGFSNYGATSVHLAAPGVFIFTTIPGSYGFADGTSMAAPMVAGAAALLLANDSSLSVDQLKARLMTSVDVLAQWGSSVSSGGRLNLLNAIALGGNAPPSVALTSPAAGTPFVAPASVALAATATDSDGTIAKVDFSANGLLVGTDTTGPGPYTAVWPDVATGSYSLTAVATDNAGASRTSSAVTIGVTPPPGRINVALAANGAVATVSSAFDANHGASGVINGDRKGLNWGSNGGWNDGTANTWPDWLEVEFNGSQTIDEIDVFTVQDSYQAPSDPTPTMTFTKYGVRNFTVQYWTGSAWQTVPSGTVTSNTLVWRQFNFAPVTTSRIRVHVTQGLAAHSRLTEVEAYAASLSGSSPPTVALTSPADGAEFPAPATMAFAATATDTDGIEKVDFYANGARVGTDTTGPNPYTFSWANVPTGIYVLTAVATDTVGATKLSTPVEVTVTAPAGRVNLALATNGAVASVSSAYNASYGASGVINGDRKGLNWGNNGGWNDGTANNWPDWLEVQFNGAQTIDEIGVFTAQDNYQSPVEPTPTMAFTLYGVRDFTVQYWNGTAWQTVPGGTVTANTLIWRRFNFTPLTTTRIRVHITQGLNAHSRLTEVEAFGVPSNNALPTVAVTQPAAGSSFVAPASITLQATAADSDGTIAKVDFYANGTLVGTDTTGPAPYTFAWTNVAPGTYALTAVATDDDGATQTSSAVSITVTAPAARVNVAASANGGVATASSSYSATYGPSGTINGDRKGQGWGSNGGWNDGTANAWPDWVEVQFSSVQTIDEIDVFTVQNNYQAPIEPTPTMTFSLYGVRDFTVQYWTGTAWLTVPGGTVTGNNLVWRKFVFAPVTTQKIRVHITNGLGSHSRLTEIEAYAISAPSPLVRHSTQPADGFIRRPLPRRAVLLD